MQPRLWSRHVVFSFLFITVTVLWLSCGERPFITPADGGYEIVGLVRDKETLEPLDSVLVGLKRPETPDSALTDSSVFMIVTPEWKETNRHPQTALWTDDDTSVFLNFNVVGHIMETRESGHFKYFTFLPPCDSYPECMKEDISRMVAWKSGYKFWKYNAQRDTIIELRVWRDSLNIYMEKLNNQ